MTNVVPTGNHCAMHLDSDQKATNVRPQPRKGWLFFVSLIVTLLVWLAFSWPLPRQVFSAIPISAQNAEKYHIRAMIPGDQLQLLYHFWLFSDMVRGKTPFFYNLYEFNTGEGFPRTSIWKFVSVIVRQVRGQFREFGFTLGKRADDVAQRTGPMPV